MGYWQSQKTIQYAEFFKELDNNCAKNSVLIYYFEFRKTPDFQLPE
jgi:hypothetical protein